jgi:sensor c-di-GMP phosphodiesterase-like protein
LINENGSIISPFFFIDMSKKGAYYNQITKIVIDNTFEALKVKRKTNEVMNLFEPKKVTIQSK